MSVETQLQMRRNVEQMHEALSELNQWVQETEATERGLSRVARSQAEIDEEELEAKEIAEAKAELARLAAREEAELPRTCEPAVALAGAPPRVASSGPTNFDKWRRFDADGAVEALERREAEREALRLKLTRLENNRAQAVLRRRQLAAEAEAEAFRARGNAAFTSARYEDAVADYTEALERAPRSSTLYSNRALALLKLRAYVEAEEDATAALDFDASNVKARLRRAQARSELSRYDEALEDLELALEAEPRNASARRQMAECRHLRSRQAEARRPKPAVKVDILSVDHDAANDEDPFVLSLAPDGAEGPLAAMAAQRMTAAGPAHETGTTAGKASVSGASVERNAPPAAPSTAPAPPRSIRPAALPPPSNAADVERAWRTLRKDEGAWRDYVRALPPARVEALFAKSLPADILSAVLAALAQTATNEAESAAHAFGILRAMSRAGRFSILVMCLDQADSRHAATIFGALEGFASVGALNDITAAEVNALRKEYE